MVYFFVFFVCFVDILSFWFRLIRLRFIPDRTHLTRSNLGYTLRSIFFRLV